MKKVILYSMGCPKCKMLKVKLEKAIIRVRGPRKNK